MHHTGQREVERRAEVGTGVDAGLGILGRDVSGLWARHALSSETTENVPRRSMFVAASAGEENATASKLALAIATAPSTPTTRDCTARNIPGASPGRKPFQWRCARELTGQSPRVVPA
jgi:hypothetical protein